MYADMTPQQRIRAYVALMLPAIRRAAEDGKLPGVLKTVDRQLADGGGPATEDTADTSRASA